jgi:hypothetical protein
MAQRSPYNDRYKVDQKGKTRSSASAAKPKRAVADLTPANSAKKAPEKKKGLFGRASSSRPSTPMPTSPRLSQLRRIWWILWVVALGVAIVILYLQQPGKGLQSFVPFGWAVWALAMGGAFYLEFVPIRKERAVLMEAAKHAVKPSKKEKAAAAAASKGVRPSAPEDDESPAPDDREPPAPTPITSA